jgi:hypothetical protein
MKDARRAHQGEIAKVEREVAAYEERHLMTSDQMRARLGAGEINETWEICQWLLTLSHLKIMRGQKMSPADVLRPRR